MVRKYGYRRKLPHLQPDSKIFFITFCTQLRWILPECIRPIIVDVCLQGHHRRFDLHALVVMPDHVHLALTLLSDSDGAISIYEIMQAIKGTSAHRINRVLGRQGRVWQEESFDRALRREEALDAKIAYMLENPVRAGLVQNPLDYRWLWRNTEGPERITLARAGTPVPPPTQD